MMELKTQRLTLRPFRESNAEDLYTYASDPRVGPIAGWAPHESAEYSLQVIRELLMDPETYALFSKESNEVIGSIGLKFGWGTDLTDESYECELGYWIGLPFWGKGLMPEAARALISHSFEDLGMNAVLCGYFEGNEQSRRVQEKLGFTLLHKSENVPVPQLNTSRTGYVNKLTRESWMKFNQQST